MVNIDNIINMNKEFFSTADVASLLGISRVAVFKKIKAGEIKAQKIGRNFFIKNSDLPTNFSSLLSDKDKLEIKKIVKKAVLDYKETLQLLGKE